MDKARSLLCWYNKIQGFESPLDSKDIKPVNLKGDKPWIFTRRTDAEADAPVFCSSDANPQLIREKKESIRGWDGWLTSWIQCPWTWENSGRWGTQGGLTCGSPWGRNQLDMPGWLKNSNKMIKWLKQIPGVWHYRYPIVMRGSISFLAICYRRRMKIL